MQTCGIVDIGSNTIQLSVYRYGEISFQLLFNRWETVGLMGYVEDGALSHGGVAAACRVLEQFKALLDERNVPSLHVFATASLRNISNTQSVLAAIRAQTGITVALLSGEEEADCSFRGATLGGASRGLVVDIGGGSTELVDYENAAIRSARSLPLGALALYRRFVAGPLPTAEEQGHIRAHILDELGPMDMRHRDVIGVGGTIRAVVKLCNLLSNTDTDNHTISFRQVQSLYTSLSTGDRQSCDLLRTAVPERAHTLMPGLMILCAVLDAVGAEGLTVSENGVREGYLLRNIMPRS